MVGPPTKKVGEDCTAHGASECVSGLCVHTSPKLGEGYVCAALCERGCPDGWQCSQLPGAEGMCLPPKGWVARAVEMPK